MTYIDQDTRMSLWHLPGYGSILHLRLRAVMLQVVALEKEIEEWEGSDERMTAVAV